MPSSYAVWYANDGTFVLAWKLEYGYYFSDDGGHVVPGGQLLNGAWNFALPGGRREGGESWAQTAYREFFEETGYYPVYVDWYEQAFTVGGYTFGAGYFQTDAATIGGYLPWINGYTLPIGLQIGQAIINGTITTYPQIAPWVAAPARGWTDWPRSNELYEVYPYNIRDPATWAVVQGWQTSPTLSWYYYILAYLRTTILGVPAPEISETAPRLPIQGGVARAAPSPVAPASVPDTARVPRPPAASPAG